MNISNTPRIAVENVTQLLKHFEDIIEDDTGKALLINVDPNDPSPAPFVPETQLFNHEIEYKSYKENFPLAEGSADADEIIRRIVEYPGSLILVNAMGSTCYNIFQEILAKRARVDRKTSYWTLINNPHDESCQNDIYNDPAHLAICEVKPCVRGDLDANE